MATNNTSITLSGQEAERLRQTIQDAHDHIQSAQRDIYRAQGCLNEVHNLLSLRSVNNTAPRLASPNSTIKAAPKAPTVKAKEQKVQNKDDYAQTSESTKPRRKARWSTDAMTDTENAFLRTQIGYTKKKKDAAYFLRPVNYEALNLPTYPNIIKQPMDLSTVETKLRNNEYDSVQSCVDDLQLIVDNARKFNGPDHAITHAAYGMLEYVYERMETISQPAQRRKRRGSLDEW